MHFNHTLYPYKHVFHMTVPDPLCNFPIYVYRCVTCFVLVHRKTGQNQTDRTFRISTRTSFNNYKQYEQSLQASEMVTNPAVIDDANTHSLLFGSQVMLLNLNTDNKSDQSVKMRIVRIILFVNCDSKPFVVCISTGFLLQNFSQPLYLKT